MHGQQGILGFPIGDYPIPQVVVLPYAPTIITPASRGNRFEIKLLGALTLGNPVGGYHGQQCVWDLLQDATGSRVLTLGSAFALGTDITSTTLTTTANKRDFLTAIYNATVLKWYVVGFVKGF